MNYLTFDSVLYKSTHIRIWSTTRFYIRTNIVQSMCRRYVPITPKSKCLQYADDTRFCQECKTSQLYACINSIEKDIQSISKWSNDRNLIFNSAKSKSYGHINSANIKTSPT